MRAPNDNLLGVLGTWSTSCEFHNLVLACDFLVVDASTQVILGTDLLKYQAVVNVGKQHCRQLGKELPFVCVLSEDGVCKVSLAGDISIPARAEVIIGGKLEGLCEGPNVGMFEPNRNVFDQHDVLVARVVASSRPEQIPLCVVNIATELVMLYKGTQIGCFEIGVAVLEEAVALPI